MHTLYPPLDDSATFCNDTTTTTSNNNNKNNPAMMKDMNVLSEELIQNFESLKDLKRKDPPTDERNETHDAKKLHLAIKTALAVESEMSRLRNGIAELEALLAEANRSTLSTTGFPILPPLVPADDEGSNDEDLESDSKSSESTGEMVHR